MEEQEILESWKEISSYLKRSAATCQRWEIEMGLPVHRLDGTPKARVFAYKDELDRWRREKLRHSETELDVPKKRSHRALRWGFALTVVSVALAVAGWRLLPRKAITPPPKAKPAAAGADAAAGSIATGMDVDLGRITTRSPEALHYYIEGCKLLLWPSGREGWQTARTYLKKAIEIDPGFAMAYSVLGSSSEPGDDQAKNLAKAIELRGSVSRRERLMIEGNQYFYVQKDDTKAIQAYTKALKIDPNDDMVNKRLCDFYMKSRDRKNALKYQEFLYKKNRFDRIQVGRYASHCESLGLYDQGIEAYRFYLDKAPEDYAMRERLYNLYWNSGHHEQALEEADKLRAAGADRSVDKVFPLYLMGDYRAAEQLCKDYARGSGSRSVWGARDWLRNIYLTQGQFEKAKEQVVLGLQEEEQLAETGQVIECHGRICLRQRLAELYMIEQKWTEAMNEADKALGIALDFKHESYQVSTLTLKAEICLGMGLADRAQEMAEKIRDILGNKTAHAMRDHLFVAGKIELERGDALKAIDRLQQARDLEFLYIPPESLSLRYPAALASCYLQAGNMRSARKEREKITLLISGRLLEGFEYALNFYALGKICEQLRDKAKAIEYYGKFLDLWKDADPVFSEVEDARARLARLKPS